MVPTKGNSDAAVAQAISIGSSIRRRASAYVQKISAAQITTRNRIRTFTAVSRPRLSMPNTARGSTMAWPRRVVGAAVGELQEGAAEGVADAEEDQDDQRDDHGDQPDHRQDAGAVAPAHSADALRAPGSLSRSATR